MTYEVTDAGPEDTSQTSLSSAIVEAKAIILFYQDELQNLRWIAENDRKGNRAIGDKLGREMDRWENHPEHVQDRFRHRARKHNELSQPSEVPAL